MHVTYLYIFELTKVLQSELWVNSKMRLKQWSPLYWDVKKIMNGSCQTFRLQRSVFCFNVCYTYNYVLGFWTLLKISCYWRNSPRSTLFFDCAILLMQMFNFWAFLGRRMMKTYFQQINWIMQINLKLNCMSK